MFLFSLNTWRWPPSWPAPCIEAAVRLGGVRGWGWGRGGCRGNLSQNLVRRGWGRVRGGSPQPIFSSVLAWGEGLLRGEGYLWEIHPKGRKWGPTVESSVGDPQNELSGVRHACTAFSCLVAAWIGNKSARTARLRAWEGPLGHHSVRRSPGEGGRVRGVTARPTLPGADFRPS